MLLDTLTNLRGIRVDLTISCWSVRAAERGERDAVSERVCLGIDMIIVVG